MTSLELAQTHAGETLLIGERLARQVLAIAASEIPTDGSEGRVALVADFAAEKMGCRTIVFDISSGTFDQLLHSAQQRLSEHQQAG